MATSEWLKLISVKYKSTKGVTAEIFDDMINQISKSIGEQIDHHEGDYIFPFKIEGVNCMCGIVLLTQNPVTECQFTVMTNEGRKPSDMYGIEPIHVLLEEIFLN